MPIFLDSPRDHPVALAYAHIYRIQSICHLHIPYIPTILSVSNLVIFSFRAMLYVVPRPEPAETAMVTEGIPVGPLM